MSSLQRHFRMSLVIVITLALMAASAAAGVAQDTTIIPGIEPIPGTPLNDTDAVPGIAPPAVPPPALAVPGIGGFAQGAALQVFDHLNIRAGPGLNFPVLVTLAPSQNFVLEGRNADTSWLQVRVPDGRVGWVSTAVITTTLNLATLPVTSPGIAPPAVPPPAADVAQGTVVNAFNLNVRSGPGLTFPIFTTLPLGTNVTVEGRDAGGFWLQVRLADGRTGWVSSAFMTTNVAITSLAVTSAAIAPPAVPPPAAPIPGLTALGASLQSFGNLNVRTGPGLHFPVLVSLPASQNFVLEGRTADGSWLWVRVPDSRQGWVSAAVIVTALDLNTLPVVDPATTTVTPPPAVPPPAAPAPGVGFSALGASLQSFGNLIIRTGPGFNFPVLVSLPLGQNFVLEGRTADGSWLWVRVPDGRHGWVSTGVITTNLDLSTLPVVDPATTTVTPPAAPPPAALESDDLAIGTVVNANVLNVRTGPGLTFPVISILPLGSSVQLEGRDTGGFWLQVRLANGRQGWVSSAFMTTNLAIANLPVSETLAPPVAATPPATPTEPAPGIGGLAVGTVVNANILNVRSGPGLTFPILTTLTLNQSVTLEGRNADGAWLQIRLAGDQLGWVSSAFMSTNLAIANLPVVEAETGAVVETPATEPAEGVGGLATGTVVNTNLLNVRSGPGLNFPVLAVLPMGESVVLEGRDTAGFWLQVRLADDRLGWVSSAFMSANLDIANLPVAG